MKRLLAAALLLASPVPLAWAVSEKAGTSGAEFLKLGADARGDAMGLAMTAAADDATSLYWNPAGLSQVEQAHLSATFSRMYEGVQYGFASFAAPLKSPITPRRREYRPSGRGTVAAGLLYLNAGTLEERDNTGRLTGGSIAPQDVAVMAGWGATVTEDFDVGASMKYIQSHIQATAQTAAGDAGARWHAHVAEWPYIAAVSARNFGGTLRFHQQQDPLPSTVSLGQSLRPMKEVLLAFDLTAPRDHAVYPAFGIEGGIPVGEDSRVALRGGWCGRTSSGDLDGTTGITLGFGLRTFGFGMDYAWLPFGVLGSSHRLTFDYRFGD
jgi:hypothetical protein